MHAHTQSMKHLYTWLLAMHVYVRPLPARFPRWPHTSQREGTLWSCCHITRSRWSNNYKATIAQTAGSRRAWLGRGDWGWATTELRLNNSNITTAPNQVQASGEQQWRQRLSGYRYAHAGPNKLPVGWATRSRWTAETIVTGRLPPVPDKLQWHLLPGGTERRSKEWSSARAFTR